MKPISTTPRGQPSRYIPKLLLTLPTRLSSSGSAVVKNDDIPGLGDPVVPHRGADRWKPAGLWEARGE
jgi:hypothetical protein